jgi:hypothetical protein
MTSFLDKLNLRPGERRLVVIVAIVVFIVLNIWLVWPSFGDWGRTENAIEAARKKLQMFNEELAKTNLYQRQMTELRAKGLYVATEDQASQLQREVMSQANLSGVELTGVRPGRGYSGGRTNAFFEEQSLDASFKAGEKELVDFLYNLGARNSLIRVRSMQIGRDPSGTRLSGSLTLVESFQKKPPPRMAAATPAASPPKTAAPPAKATPPATATATPKPAATPPPPAKTGVPAPTPAKGVATPPPAAKGATSAPPAAPNAPAPKTTNWLRRLLSASGRERAA